VKVITLARKPFAASAAECAVEWGTGSVNVDGSRVGSEARTYKGFGNKPGNVPNTQEGSSILWLSKPATTKALREHASGDMTFTAVGRFPSNLIFQHMSTCEIVGSREVKTGEAVRERSGGKTIFSETAKPPMKNMTYGEGGKESIPDWRCEDGCPVPDLDVQSGISTSKAHTRNNKGSWKVRKKGNTTASVDTSHSDTGGASRFFKQVKPGIDPQAAIDALQRYKGQQPRSWVLSQMLRNGYSAAQAEALLRKYFDEVKP